MSSLNEQVFMTEYMRVTECSEAQARSVYIFMDVLVVREAAQGSGSRQTMQTREPASRE